MPLHALCPCCPLKLLVPWGVPIFEWQKLKSSGDSEGGYAIFTGTFPKKYHPPPTRNSEQSLSQVIWSLCGPFGVKWELTFVLSQGGVGAQWIRKICLPITPCNVQNRIPFCAEYMVIVIMFKQGALGFAATKRISVRTIFPKNPKWFTVPQCWGTVNQTMRQGESH